MGTAALCASVRLIRIQRAVGAIKTRQLSCFSWILVSDRQTRKKRETPHGVSLFPLQVLKLLQALGADVLALEDGDVLAAVTENAAGTVLFENDGGTLHIDFQ